MSPGAPDSDDVRTREGRSRGGGARLVESIPSLQLRCLPTFADSDFDSTLHRGVASVQALSCEARRTRPAIRRHGVRDGIPTASFRRSVNRVPPRADGTNVWRSGIQRPWQRRQQHNSAIDKSHRDGLVHHSVSSPFGAFFFQISTFTSFFPGGPVVLRPLAT